MKLEQKASFIRDLKRLKNKEYLKRVYRKIKELKEASSIADISGLRKVQPTKSTFRIRVGDYRLTVELKDNKLELVRYQHRRESYR